ncbi:MAG TPA: sigma-70 family RNA polymerase sigma factor [Ignavibacteriaceae bacterium]|nr:sigma-70 family RNA polymerase sigma factor [Ignavibacteriaceae bacterium]
MRRKNKRKMEFEILVKQNMRRAYFVALGFLGSHDSAMELSQEAFIRAYRNFNRFDKNRKFFTWYYKILKNLCLNFLRDNKNHNRENYLELSKKAVMQKSPEQELEEKEITEKLNNAIDSLNEIEREILILREFEGMCYRDISELLNIPEGTVMSRLYYARKKLSSLMKRSYYE